jgi:hypothetical protein
MPIDCAPDCTRQRLFLAAQGGVKLDDLLAALVQRAHDGTWQFSVLFDVGESVPSLSVDEISLLAFRVRELSSTRGAPGPMAIVVAETAGGWVELLCSQLALTGGQFAAAFPDLRAACDWLDEQRGDCAARLSNDESSDLTTEACPMRVWLRLWSRAPMRLESVHHPRAERAH